MQTATSDMVLISGSILAFRHRCCQCTVLLTIKYKRQHTVGVECGSWQHKTCFCWLRCRIYMQDASHLGGRQGRGRHPECIVVSNVVQVRRMKVIKSWCNFVKTFPSSAWGHLLILRKMGRQLQNTQSRSAF